MPDWELIDDCLAGDRVVKAKGTLYLPMPDESTPRPGVDQELYQWMTAEQKRRYKTYLQRAVFYNCTARTLNGLVGQVFAVDPEWEAPQALMRYEDDIDGSGISLYQQSKDALSQALAKGRVAMYTDYTATQEDTTVEQVEAGISRPVIVLYDAAQVINWRTERIGSQAKLSLVVVEDTREVYEDGDPFEPTKEPIWRVLQLEEGRFVVRVYEKSQDKDEKGKEKFELVEEYFPLDGSGTPFDEIPFTFVGSLNNDPWPDSSPLYDLAVLNLAHFRNSADYEESCFVTGQATVGISTDLDHDQFQKANPSGVALGSRGGVFLGATGSLTLVQSAPNSQPFEAMQHKERQMVALGAKLVEQGAVQRTAKEASMENASETSILASIAHNVSEAYIDHLLWMARYLNVAVERKSVRFDLNTKFDAQGFTGELLREFTAMWRMQGLSDTEYRENLRKLNVHMQDDEQWRDALESGVASNPGLQQTGLQMGGLAR